MRKLSESLGRRTLGTPDGAHRQTRKKKVYGTPRLSFPGPCGTSVAIISAHGSARIEDLNAFDFARLGVATFLIHLITYDKILDFIRLAVWIARANP
jgi:hypothetical protein